MKKKMACALAFLIIIASVTLAFAGGRHSHGGHNYGHRHHRGYYGPLLGLGAFGLGFGLGRAYDWRYGERIIIDPQPCVYEFSGYAWNPTWQRWDAVWVLVCR